MQSNRECLDCGWDGDSTELVALTDDEDDLDFSHCPNCESGNIDEIETDDDED